MNAMTSSDKPYPIKLSIRLFIEKDRDGEFIVYSPEFKSVYAGGITKEEALENFKIAFKSHIISLIKHNKAISCIPKNEKTKNQIIEEIEISPNCKSYALV